MYTVCSCAGQSFWEGPCEYCIANPEPRPVIDPEEYGASVTVSIDKFFDDMIDRCAAELGWRAGLSVSGFEPGQHFENGGGI